MQTLNKPPTVKVVAPGAGGGGAAVVVAFTPPALYSVEPTGHVLEDPDGALVSGSEEYCTYASTEVTAPVDRLSSKVVEISG
jgi:hypothetical protein